MRVSSLCVAVLVLGLTAPAFSAAARRIHAGWPSRAVIQKAEARINYQNDRTIRGKYRGREVTFVPCDISEISDSARRQGMILGKLVLGGASPDKLPAGTYTVFAWVRNNTWEAYFVQGSEPVAKSTETKSDLDNEHKPSFEKDTTTIRYWRLRVAF